MIASDYWKLFYEGHSFPEPSAFAQFVLPSIQGTLVDLGCGDGRDLYYFHRNEIPCYGVDASNENILIIKQSVDNFMRENPCPDNVYTRFFWHAIEDDTREHILKWTTKNLYIEARTTKDKPKNLYGKHERNLVDTKKLLKMLDTYNFKVITYVEGHGMSTHFEEDPHLVRVIAHRVL